jgi:hypothetical protein
MRLRWILISAVVLGCGMGQQTGTPKPRCNASNRGSLWPPVHERDACHPVELCTLEVWKYRWVPVTVSVSQLAKDSKHRSPCKSSAVE